MGKDINKSLKTELTILLVFSALFVAGIPAIPVGFAGGLIWLGILGCIFVGGGFYGLPLGWVHFGEQCRRRAIVRAVTDDGLTDVSELASNFGKSEKSIRQSLVTIFNKRYLPGYKFNADKTALVAFEKAAPVKKIRKCESCGAALTGDGVCPYCGAAHS
ncbi:MAG: hypothetical protein LBC13_02965 [Clostridiales bacterium]|jgi:hypothetical protein|nr:hypothetical protein [Clostridiales bacterium]